MTASRSRASIAEVDKLSAMLNNIICQLHAEIAAKYQKVTKINIGIAEALVLLAFAIVTIEIVVFLVRFVCKSMKYMDSAIKRNEQDREEKSSKP